MRMTSPFSIQGDHNRVFRRRRFQRISEEIGKHRVTQQFFTLNDKRFNRMNRQRIHNNFYPELALMGKILSFFDNRLKQLKQVDRRGLKRRSAGVPF